MAAVEQSEQRRQRRRRGPCSLASASDSELMPSMLRLRLRLMGTTALLLMLVLMLLLVLVDQARADAPPAHRRLPRIQWAQNEARLFVTLQMEGEMVGDPQIRLNETHFAVEATTLKSKASSPPTSGAGAAAVKSMPELAETDQSDQAVESSQRNTKEQQQASSASTSTGTGLHKRALEDQWNHYVLEVELREDIVPSKSKWARAADGGIRLTLVKLYPHEFDRLLKDEAPLRKLISIDWRRWNFVADLSSEFDAFEASAFARRRLVTDTSRDDDDDDNGSDDGSDDGGGNAALTRKQRLALESYKNDFQRSTDDDDDDDDDNDSDYGHRSKTREQLIVASRDASQDAVDYHALVYTSFPHVMQLGAGNFSDALDSANVVVVHVSYPWCKSCRYFEHEFLHAAERVYRRVEPQQRQHTHAPLDSSDQDATDAQDSRPSLFAFGRIDAREERELGLRYGAQCSVICEFHLFRAGSLAAVYHGISAEDQMTKFIQRHMGPSVVQISAAQDLDALMLAHATSTTPAAAHAHVLAAPAASAMVLFLRGSTQEPASSGGDISELLPTLPILQRQALSEFVAFADAHRDDFTFGFVRLPQVGRELLGGQRIRPSNTTASFNDAEDWDAPGLLEAFEADIPLLVAFHHAFDCRERSLCFSTHSTNSANRTPGSKQPCVYAETLSEAAQQLFVLDRYPLLVQRDVGIDRYHRRNNFTVASLFVCSLSDLSSVLIPRDGRDAHVTIPLGLAVRQVADQLRHKGLMFVVEHGPVVRELLVVHGLVYSDAPVVADVPLAGLTLPAFSCALVNDTFRDIESQKSAPLLAEDAFPRFGLVPDSELASQLSQESILQHSLAVVEGRAMRTYKSESPNTVTENAHMLHRVTAASFDRICRNPTNDVLLEIYHPLAQNHAIIQRGLEALSRVAHRHLPSLIVAQMDASKNFVPPAFRPLPTAHQSEELSVEDGNATQHAYPILVLFPAHASGVDVHYQYLGPLSAHNLLNFVHRHAGHDFELPVASRALQREYLAKVKKEIPVGDLETYQRSANATQSDERIRKLKKDLEAAEKLLGGPTGLPNPKSKRKSKLRKTRRAPKDETVTSPLPDTTRVVEVAFDTNPPPPPRRRDGQEAAIAAARGFGFMPDDFQAGHPDIPANVLDRLQQWNAHSHTDEDGEVRHSFTHAYTAERQPKSSDEGDSSASDNAQPQAL